MVIAALCGACNVPILTTCKTRTLIAASTDCTWCRRRCGCFFQFGLDAACARRGAGSAAGNRQVMPDDHSELVPPLPIPNRTVKRLCADDSAATSVKVGHRQAVTPENPRRP